MITETQPKMLSRRSGVDLFFVLSVFLIGGILLNARCLPHILTPIVYAGFSGSFRHVWILCYLVVGFAGPFSAYACNGGKTGDKATAGWWVFTP
jgi:hypothetical protein